MEKLFLPQKFSFSDGSSAFFWGKNIWKIHKSWPSQLKRSSHFQVFKLNIFLHFASCFISSVALLLLSPSFFLLAKLWVASERNGEKKSMQSLPHYVHATPSPPRLCAAVILGRGKLFPGCCWKIKKNFDARLARFKCFASLSAFPITIHPPYTHTQKKKHTHIGRTEKIAKTHTFVHR